MISSNPDYTFDSIEKDPAATRSIALDFYAKSANFWRKNEQYTASEYIRPNVSTGFAYQAVGSGLSGNREPRWPTSVGATVVDGSLTWVCVAAGANGLNAVSSPTAVSDPTGLTISAVAVSETCKVLLTYAGGTANQDYDAVVSFILNGVPRVARQKVRIRYQ